MRRVATSWKVIEAVLRQNAHASFKALRKGATDQILHRLQEHFGPSLPADLMASLRLHDGMRQQTVFVDFMTLLSSARILYWSRVQRDVQQLGEFSANHKISAIRKGMRWRDQWVPIAVDAGGNLVVVDLEPARSGKRGQVFHWDNVDGPTKLIADSFGSWVNHLAEELQSRRFALDEFGEIELHNSIV